jgi:serine protease Do
MSAYFSQIKRGLAALVAVALLNGAQAARANTALYNKTLLSTGWVVVPLGGNGYAWGTGWVIDREQKLLVTNYHVVANKRDVQIYFPTWTDNRLTVDARVYWTKVRPEKGRVVFISKARDLALIQLTTMPKHIRQLPLAARPPQVGEAMHSIGNSSVGPAVDSGYLWRYTRGEVRLLRRIRDTFKDGQAINCRVVETSSPTNNGDSGGPVVNDRGELVAVVSCCATKDRNISWFIEVSEVRAFVRAYFERMKQSGQR